MSAIQKISAENLAEAVSRESSQKPTSRFTKLPACSQEEMNECTLCSSALGSNIPVGLGTSKAPRIEKTKRVAQLVTDFEGVVNAQSNSLQKLIFKGNEQYELMLRRYCKANLLDRIVKEELVPAFELFHTFLIMILNSLKKEITSTL